MKKYLAFLIFLLILFGIGTYVVYAKQSQNKDIESPLPDFLNKEKNSQVSTLDVWLPSVLNFFTGGTSNEKPNLSAKSALVYDITEGKVIYEKNPNEKLPMASITKIMTAMIAIDNKKDDDKYVVYKEDLVGENVMGLTSGEILSLNDLLYGLVLNSGNDAAEVLATNTMERSKFIKAMNDKALSLGLKNTHFTNPTGLEGDGDQHTTVYDLLVLTRHIMDHYPQFAKAAGSAEYHIPATSDHKAFDLYNEVNLVTSYPGVKGVKDGYTPEAGLCLVTYLDYKGHRIIGVILGSENRREEMKELLDYSLTIQGVAPPPHS